MALTPFANFFLPVLLAVWLVARQWLPALLILSTCLQATSVLNVTVGDGKFGVSPYLLTAFIAFLLLLWRVWKHHVLPLPPTHLRPATCWLLGYSVLAIIGAFALPHLFSGVPVYLLLNKFGFDRGTTPLIFTFSNLAQAINLAVHVCVLLFLIQARKLSESTFDKMLYGVIVAVALVLAIGVYERLASLGWWTSHNSFWMSNPGYAQLHNHAVAGFRRIVAPFSEASYATTFLAAVWCGLLAVCLFGRCRIWQISALVLVGIGLINPLGSTGWVTAAGAATFLLLMATGMAIRGQSAQPTQLRRRVQFGWMAVSIIFVASAWAWTSSPASPKIKAIADTVILNKLGSASARARHRSNEHAVQIVSNTWGLGAGLGSNRASSYVASLASNTGIAGLLCFFAMLTALTWAYMRAEHLGDGQIFALSGMWTATLAVALAIPDLNLPVYWTFIFLVFLGCPEPAATKHNRAARPS